MKRISFIGLILAFVYSIAVANGPAKNNGQINLSHEYQDNEWEILFDGNMGNNEVSEVKAIMLSTEDLDGNSIAKFIDTITLNESVQPNYLKKITKSILDNIETTDDGYIFSDLQYLHDFGITSSLNSLRFTQ